MDIKEIRIKKWLLAEKIEDLIKQFEDENNLSVDEIKINDGISFDGITIEKTVFIKLEDI